jgi:hypothetical protein
MRRCRFAVKVSITATSDGSAPTTGAMLSDALVSASSHGGSGEAASGLK